MEGRGHPGWQPVPGPLDLAEPALGGHVAWLDRQPSGVGSLDSMLDEDLTYADWVGIDPERTSRAEWVLGFREGRAAQVTELQWQDPLTTDPNIRLERIELASSMEGPLGPWTSLGSWELVRDASGAVTPYTLDAPTWARYLRMIGPIRASHRDRPRAARCAPRA